MKIQLVPSLERNAIHLARKGDSFMGLVIIFALITLLSVISTVSALKNKNMLGIVFGLATLGVFGWFTVMTVLNSGYPGQ
jgi:uncharacterized membrane protein